MKNILIPIDGSPYSSYAVKVATELAVCSGLKLNLLNVQRRELPLESLVLVAGFDKREEYLYAVGSKIVEDTVKQFEGMNFNTEVKLGEPHEEILKYAKEIGADIIIMGTHGYTGLTGIFMGSISTKVVSKSDIPVMLTKNPDVVETYPKYHPYVADSLIGKE